MRKISIIIIRILTAIAVVLYGLKLFGAFLKTDTWIDIVYLSMMLLFLLSLIFEKRTKKEE